MELFVTWALAFAVVFLVTALTLGHKSNLKLEKENECKKENYKLLQEKTHLIENIALKLNDICLSTTKPIDRKSISILAIEDKSFTTDENDNIIGLNLTAIRFKNTQEGVLVYLNGAMAPFDGDVICSPIELQNVDKIDCLYTLPTIFNKKDSNIKFTIHSLRSILNNLNK